MKSDYLSSEDFGVKDFSELSDSKIVNAVAEMVEKLDLGSGSTNSMKLYDLLKIYLKDIDSRMKINEILKNTEGYETEGFIDIKSKKQSFEFWAGSMKNYVEQYDKRFCPEVMDDNTLREKSELKEYLDRLYHLHSMMVNDLL